GHHVPVYSANYLVSGVFILPGDHQLVMKYEPSMFTAGLRLSLLSLFIWFIFIVRVTLLQKSRS
ncbi:MAG TPA: hypothetical protein VGB30_13840, partial [bacterium]